MSKYTPGPWHYAGIDFYERRVIIKGDKPDFINHANEICRIDKSQAKAAMYVRGLIDEAEANAKLIAAAPELLEACQRALREIKDGETTVGLEEDLIAAIAKAERK